MDWRSRISDATADFQDGGADVGPPLAAAYAESSAGAFRARVTSLARCMRYSS